MNNIKFNNNYFSFYLLQMLRRFVVEFRDITLKKEIITYFVEKKNICFTQRQRWSYWLQLVPIYKEKKIKSKKKKNTLDFRKIMLQTCAVLNAKASSKSRLFFFLKKKPKVIIHYYFLKDENFSKVTCLRRLSSLPLCCSIFFKKK